MPNRLLVLAAAFVWPCVALAHAALLQATPPVGSTVSTSPREVRLTFSEGVEKSFSAAEVSAANGERIPARSRVEGSEIIVPLSTRLPPGVYRVNWHVLSVDGHRTSGDFRFEVRPNP